MKYENFIKVNNHLPSIPSEKEVAEKGINIGEMQAKLLAKIEKLTLHLIEQNKKNSNLSKIVTKQQNLISDLENRLSSIENN